jgi:hypothetical protein
MTLPLQWALKKRVPQGEEFEWHANIHGLKITYRKRGSVADGVRESDVLWFGKCFIKDKLYMKDYDELLV